MTAPNRERRKTVMGRSLKLGRCVCDPTKPCPCPRFREYNVCECAGEKLPAQAGPVALMRYARKTGCASKIGQADLLRVLSGLPAVTDPNVLVGMAAGDDAGVYRLSDGRCLVQTVDVFTPCVDDARLFGRIAAANALSDCYAMGARPLTALSIVCFPIDTLDGETMRQMLLGGMEKLEEAGCALIGGHSVNDEEVKCGFAITGLLESGTAVERGRARAGDTLVLTKPLGTGILSFAAQIGRLSPEWQAEMGRHMETLNRDAAELMVEHGAHACTDVTGFGLAGHLIEMARGSGVRAEVSLASVPVFAPVVECLREGVFAGAVEKNMEYAMAWVRRGGDEGDEEGQDGKDPRDNKDHKDGKDVKHGGAGDGAASVLYDPQTSGGLLIALAPERAGKLVEDLHERGHAAASVIGRMAEATDERTAGTLWVCGEELGNLVGEAAGGLLPPDSSVTFPADTATASLGGTTMENQASCCAAGPPEPAASCCTNPPAAPEAGAPGAATQASATPQAAPASAAATVPARFVDFLKEANKPGLLDARVKKLMAIGLSVAQRCEPCLRIHLESAVKMGLSRAEIDEAAWIGIGFAGSPAMMLYQAVAKETLR